MNIKICDALPGQGKTTACINMMNSSTDKKFIFVTQYLSEVDRIKSACSSKDFVSPEPNVCSKFTKLSDANRLIREGRNIATTHSLFLSYTEETKQLIENQHYVLVLDEVIDVMAMSPIAKCDVDILKRGKVLTEDESESFEWNDTLYGEKDDGAFHDAYMIAKSKNLIRFDENYFCWVIPPELFTVFDDVYVLTYMFHGQTLRCFFDSYNIAYEYIGVRKENEEYCFCPIEQYKNKIDLRDKIHILENEKLNSIGERRGDLSFSWYGRALKVEGKPSLVRLRNNIYNVFRNIFNSNASESMWTTYKVAKNDVRGKGFWNNFVSYNKRASNEYAGRNCLAYCVNNFLRPWESEFYRKHGADIDNDAYALSVMIQWVFRSAIRNGKEIWLYVPSARMRGLFLQWMDRLANGDDMKNITQIVRRSYRTEKYIKKSKEKIERRHNK